jgi:uncharacterized membrane protein
MSRIQIADLQVNGTELFQGTESFLTELQSVEANAIYGGKKCGGSKKKTAGKSSGGCKVGKSSANKSTGKISGGGCGGPTPNTVRLS